MCFRDLPIGETFAFQPARVSRSRILRCRKLSPRIYVVTIEGPDGNRLAIEHITHWHTPVYQQGLTGVCYEV